MNLRALLKWPVVGLVALTSAAGCGSGADDRARPPTLGEVDDEGDVATTEQAIGTCHIDSLTSDFPSPGQFFYEAPTLTATVSGCDQPRFTWSWLEEGTTTWNKIKSGLSNQAGFELPVGKYKLRVKVRDKTSATYQSVQKLPFEVVPVAGSCTDAGAVCGDPASPSPSNCYCDSECITTYGDCCADVCSVCSLSECPWP